MGMSVPFASNGVKANRWHCYNAPPSQRMAWLLRELEASFAKNIAEKRP